eukprot:8036362-Pyramimonas_sp.AAC.1
MASPSKSSATACHTNPVKLKISEAMGRATDPRAHGQMLGLCWLGQLLGGPRACGGQPNVQIFAASSFAERRNTTSTGPPRFHFS